MVTLLSNQPHSPAKYKNIKMCLTFTHMSPFPRQFSILSHLGNAITFSLSLPPDFHADSPQCIQNNLSKLNLWSCHSLTPTALRLKLNILIQANKKPCLMSPACISCPPFCHSLPFTLHLATFNFSFSSMHYSPLMLTHQLSCGLC